MQKIFKPVLIIIFSLGICFASDAPTLFNVEKWAATSGMKVSFVKVPNKIINIKLIFDAGSARDGNNYGLAALTSSLVDAGGATLSLDQIANSFDSVGSIYGSSISKDYATISLQSAVGYGYFEKAFSIFIDVIAAPNFSDKDFNRAKDQTMQSIKIMQQDPEKVAFQQFFHELYQGHPYGHLKYGSLETVKALTKKDVQSFYRNYYAAANASLVIVGDVDISDAKHIAAKIDEALPAGEPAPMQKLAVSNGAKHKKISHSSSQSTLIFGKLGIAANNKDFFALELGSHILGGGMKSRLSEDIREKQGLVYGVYSAFIPMKLIGPYFITMQTKAQNTKAADEGVHKVVDIFISDGVTAVELAQAKNVINGRIYNKFTTNAGIASALASQLFYNLPEDYFLTYADKINEVSLDDVNKIIKKYMSLKDSSSIIVGPNEQEK